MSALRHGMVSRLVKCCNAFDNDLLRSVKQGIALLPAPAHRVRLPLDRNTKVGASMSQVMLVTGVKMGFFLCLRSSEYISKRVVPLVDTHQFLSTDVKFVLRDGKYTLINSNQIRHYEYTDFKTVKFSMQHAKNIRNDFGVPIYDIKVAVKSSAAHFGLDTTSFNTHSIRMSAPTIARAANLSVANIMKMGRWKSLPAPVISWRSSITRLCSPPKIFNFPGYWLRETLRQNNPPCDVFMFRGRWGSHVSS